MIWDDFYSDKFGGEVLVNGDSDNGFSSGWSIGKAKLMV